MPASSISRGPIRVTRTNGRYGSRSGFPDGKVLIPGVIDTLTNHVEHPRLVAQRLETFARIAGRENVIAGTDCGFGTFVGWSGCDPKVAWLKLEALAQGARIASDRLY